MAQNLRDRSRQAKRDKVAALRAAGILPQDRRRKISPEAVDKIRAERLAGGRLTDIAAKHGTSTSNVTRIAQIGWKGVET